MSKPPPLPSAPIIATVGNVGKNTGKVMTAWLKLTPEQQETERPSWLEAAASAALSDGYAYTVHEERTVLVFGEQI